MKSKMWRDEQLIIEKLIDIAYEIEADESVALKWRDRLREQLDKLDEFTGPMPNDDDKWGIG
jgi:hypothetical protein